MEVGGDGPLKQPGNGQCPRRGRGRVEEMEEGVTTHYITYMVYRGQCFHQARAVGVDLGGGGHLPQAWVSTVKLTPKAVVVTGSGRRALILKPLYSEVVGHLLKGYSLIPIMVG